MSVCLNIEQKRDLARRGFSRRSFGRIAAVIGAGASTDDERTSVGNPNNPAGTLAPRSDIEWLLENKPKGSVLLLDEAYIHIAGAQTGSDLVAKDKDIIILRTFSKIYGMAGLRA